MNVTKNKHITIFTDANLEHKVTGNANGPVKKIWYEYSVFTYTPYDGKSNCLYMFCFLCCRIVPCCSQAG